VHLLAPAPLIDPLGQGLQYVEPSEYVPAGQSKHSKYGVPPADAS